MDNNELILHIRTGNLEPRKVEINDLNISQSDLLTLLNYDRNSNNTQFLYNTQIFNDELMFRCQKTQTTQGYILSFRFLDNGSKINLSFNDKIVKFEQYYALNEKLLVKNIAKTITKI